MLGLGRSRRTPARSHAPNLPPQPPQRVLRVYKEERNYILSMVKKIKASGCNVLLIQKSILRDAVTELSLHYLAKAKIMVVRDIERADIEFIAKVRGRLRGGRGLRSSGVGGQTFTRRVHVLVCPMPVRRR